MITDQQLTEYGLPFGLVLLILYMVFIVYRLGKDSKAGRFGMFVLFLGLMVGVLGFSIKFVIKLFLQQNVG
ncbi:DUF2788 domain-containing protein [Thiohalobacter sp. IOR34]|uniref:DUF2788 domain-containing protein n=1 Tax=Thiohalobacter sp. IOR34 TaxID=3057176 RepID=UPI0025B044C8|nr:DUF2788 domain-containing protein [Thiohalobacter sp. IOR34]WJW76226.1 DUF2788 domain-containing protein [Thiohalobacter sp. IOR34]